MTQVSSTVDVQVGAELPALALPAVSRTTLALFAGASGDHNPIHIDIDAARAAGLEDVFAHGMLSMAYLGRLLTSWIPQSRLRSLSCRFVAITPVLAVPTCTGTIDDISPLDGERLATISLVIRLDDGTETVRGQAVVALP